VQIFISLTMARILEEPQSHHGGLNMCCTFSLDISIKIVSITRRSRFSAAYPLVEIVAVATSLILHSRASIIDKIKAGVELWPQLVAFLEYALRHSGCPLDIWQPKSTTSMSLEESTSLNEAPLPSIVILAYDRPQPPFAPQLDHNQHQPKRQCTGPINIPPPVPDQPDGTAISFYTSKVSASPQSVGTGSLTTDTEKKLSRALETTFFVSELSKMAARWINELEPQRKELYGWYCNEFSTPKAVIPPWWPTKVPYRKPQGLRHKGKYRCSISFIIC
jgi:hypothetical protein